MAKASVAKVESGKEPETNAERFEKERIADSKLIKGVFQDNEIKGGTIRFPFKKWPGDKIEIYQLTDGCEYELPLAVVKHLNSNCYYQEDAYANGLVTADGKPLKNTNPKKKHRFSFKTSEYM